jgi:alkylated DNA repair dioxygenase AlkB
MIIPGLVHLPAHVGPDEARALLAAVDEGPWLADLARRVQHHGYRYDYKARSVTRESWLGPLPAWAAPLAQRLVSEGHFAALPDQLIVNEYEPGQGIARHVDCVPCFGPTIASLTLGSGCQMDFHEVATGQNTSLYLAPGSLLVLGGPARLDWTHEIRKRQSDEVGGVRVPRSRRVSLTFRTVRLGTR